MQSPPLVGDVRLGPDVFFEYVRARVGPSTAALPNHDDVEDGNSQALFQLADVASRSSLRQLQLLRRTFGLLLPGTAPDPVPRHPSMSISTSGMKSLADSTRSATGSQYPLEADELLRTRLKEHASEELRQRRLIADMYVVQWKRLYDSFLVGCQECADEAHRRRASLLESRTEHARQEREDLRAGLAFLRGRTGLSNNGGHTNV